jgi:hypothetical protein
MTKNPKLTLTQQSWIGEYTDDPLTQVRQAAGQLTDYQVALENRVAAARDALVTWQQIGDVFGISKQAAQQRFGAND